MGRIVGTLITVILVWGALAQIMPGVFQVHEKSRFKQYLWGPKSIWLAVIAAGALLGFYIWNLESRLAALDTLPHAIPISSPDETSVRFAQWTASLNPAACSAVIDASKLPPSMREKYDVALACGFVDPSTDPFKDPRISLSAPFTPQDDLSISAPISRSMMDGINSSVDEAMKKLMPPPKPGKMLTVENQFWLKILLLPKAFDTSNIQKLEDVPLHGGIISGAADSMSVVHEVRAK